MARVLILSLLFPPDNVSTAHIMGDLAVDLRDAGHEVAVVTAKPHYNRDAGAEGRQPLTRSGFLFFRSDFHGIPTVHAWVSKKGRSIAARLLSWSGFHVLTTLAGLRQERPDVIICPSPPLTIAVTAWALGLWHRASFIYNVQEMYPDIAVNLGVVRNRSIIAALHALERFVYRKAAAVTVIGFGMKQNLLSKGVPAGKIHVIPNFVDIDVLVPLPKENEFSRAHDVSARFVVSYAGNMGPAQGLETFVGAAALLRDEPDITFMMIGNGILRDDLEACIRDYGVDAKIFLFLPMQPFSRVPAIYATSDVNLVPLAAGTGSDAIPSKVYRIMACERPILACADPRSELATIVREAECGEVVPPGDPVVLAEAIRAASRDRERWKRMGRNGRAYVLTHYTRAKVTRRYAELVEALVGHPRRS